MEKNHSQVVDELFNFDYHQLRRLAHRVRSGWQGDPTLGTTVPIHEAYLRLARDRGRVWDCGHLLAVASRAMRQVLINYAEHKRADKRGGALRQTSLDDVYLTPGAFEDLLELERALQRLERESPAGTGGRVPFLWWTERRGNGRGDRDLGRDGQARLASGSGVPPSRAGRRAVSGVGAMTQISTTDLSPERWRRVEDLFAKAWEVPATERATVVHGLAGDDHALAAEVLSLVDAAEESPDYLDGIAARLQLAGGELDPVPDRIGRRVGPYTLTRVLGRGGMGSVYLAERADGAFAQTVAVKLLPAGTMRPALERRFLAERQILARMEHPHIARLLDGGVTEDGMPYFVMEDVDGVPIDEYCEQRVLSTEHRLRLFLSVCTAVDSAHRNLVIHRDSNRRTCSSPPRALSSCSTSASPSSSRATTVQPTSSR